jgi:GNAT superfamily N-acetyltransferase
VLEIRVAEPEDLGPAAQVLVAAYQDRGFLGHAEDGYAAHLADTAGRARDAELYVAALDGTVVGTVTFCPNGSVWGEIAEPGEGEFRMLGVWSAVAGRGVGRALVERCLARSRELGYHAVVLSSLPTMTDAHRVYHQLGFVRTPERDWSPAPGVDLWAYRLTL